MSLKQTAIALSDRGMTNVVTVCLDVTDGERLDEFAAFATSKLAGIDLLLVAVGDLGSSELDALDGGSVSGRRSRISPARPRRSEPS